MEKKKLITDMLSGLSVELITSKIKLQDIPEKKKTSSGQTVDQFMPYSEIIINL